MKRNFKILIGTLFVGAIFANFSLNIDKKIVKLDLESLVASAYPFTEDEGFVWDCSFSGYGNCYLLLPGHNGYCDVQVCTFTANNHDTCWVTEETDYGGCA